MRGKPSSFRDPDVWIPVAIIAMLLVLRLLAVFRHQFDSDEAQHLHMIYGWLHGELPYRDRFDNHTPLLYLLFLPLAALVGETPQIVLLARLAEIPIGLGIIVLIFLIARRLADRQVALWTIAFTLAFADWSLKLVEFRPDVLWTLCWFAALWLLVRPPERPGTLRFLAVGILLGGALCSSIKTTFLVPALAIGWVGAWMFSTRFRQAYPLRDAPRLALAGGIGFALPPTLLFGWLIAHGTSPETLKYCLFSANQAPFEPLRVAIAVILAPFALLAAWRIARLPTSHAGLVSALFLAVSSYLLALSGFSPELRKQTFLVVWPLVLFFLAWAGATSLRRRNPQLVTPLGCLACAALTAHFAVESALWNAGLRDHRALLAETLGLTDPSDHVLDRKGETIFRRRPIYLVYQHATLRGFNEGRLAEPSVSRLPETQTSVVLADAGGFPDTMRTYLKRNFLPVDDGLLRVPGQLVKSSFAQGRHTVTASVEQPGAYVVITSDAPPQFVTIPAAGRQTIELGPTPPKRALLFWKAAWDRGARPGERALMLLTPKAPPAGESGK